MHTTDLAYAGIRHVGWLETELDAAQIEIFHKVTFHPEAE